MPAAIAWFAGMGWGCLAQVRADGGAVALGLSSWHCALAITLVSAPMLLVMLLLVRHAGVVRPVPTTVLAMLSAAGPVVRRGQPGPRPRKRAAHPGLAWRRGAAAVRGGVAQRAPAARLDRVRAPLTGTLLRATGAGSRRYQLNSL